MAQNEKDDFDIVSIIKLLYIISDVHHVCEDLPELSFESAVDMHDMLSTAQSLCTYLLARASDRQSRAGNDAHIDGSDANIKRNATYN